LRYEYTITKEEYIEALTYQMKEKRKISWVFGQILFAFTVSVIPIVIVGITDGEKLSYFSFFLWLFSFVFCVIFLFSPLYTKMKARNIFAAQMKSGMYSDSLYGKFSFVVQENVFHHVTALGSSTYQYKMISKVEEHSKVILIFIGEKNKVIVVPCSLFHEVGHKNAFIDDLNEKAKRAKEKDITFFSSEFFETEELPICKASFSMNENEIIEKTIKGSKLFQKNCQTGKGNWITILCSFLLFSLGLFLLIRSCRYIYAGETILDVISAISAGTLFILFGILLNINRFFQTRFFMAWTYRKKLDFQNLTVQQNHFFYQEKMISVRELEKNELSYFSISKILGDSENIYLIFEGQTMTILPISSFDEKELDTVLSCMRKFQKNP